MLPYTVRHTTVTFGGHDSWARAIKPMLEGDVRFIDRDMQPEASLIRHAEMVWLQPNSIRHAFFYKIIKIVRTYHIPFHYFKFASAEKCADSWQAWTGAESSNIVRIGVPIIESSAVLYMGLRICFTIPEK